MSHLDAVMDIGTAILIIGFAALVAAFCLLVIGLVFSEVMNSEIPPGVSNHGKLHLLHCWMVGIAVGVSVCMRLVDLLRNSPNVEYIMLYIMYTLYNIRIII